MKTADGYPVVCYGVKGKYNIHRICRRCAITVNTIRFPKSHATGFMEYTCWAEENARSLNKKLSQYKHTANGYRCFFEDSNDWYNLIKQDYE